jgi:hypothetical protein
MYPVLTTQQMAHPPSCKLATSPDMHSWSSLTLHHKLRQSHNPSMPFFLQESWNALG